MRRVINTILGTSLVVTALYLGATRVAFADEGAYSCCGIGNCRYLDSQAACPNGNGDCTSSSCCESRCNDPKAD